MIIPEPLPPMTVTASPALAKAGSPTVPGPVNKASRVGSVIVTDFEPVNELVVLFGWASGVRKNGEPGENFEVSFENDWGNDWPLPPYVLVYVNTGADAVSKAVAGPPVGPFSVIVGPTLGDWANDDFSTIVVGTVKFIETDSRVVYVIVTLIDCNWPSVESNWLKTSGSLPDKLGVVGPQFGIVGAIDADWTGVTAATALDSPRNNEAKQDNPMPLNRIRIGTLLGGQY